MTTRTITSRLAKLQQYGFIKIIIDRNDKNEVIGRRIYLQDLPEITNTEDKSVYTPIESNFDTPIEKNIHTPMENSFDTPIERNFQYNNTRDINNTSMNITRENRDTCSDIEYNNIIESFNKICVSLFPYPKIKKDDKKHIAKILNKGIDYIDLFQRVQQSDFLSGRNGKWRHCTFSWIIQPDNIKKILNGSYGNRSPSKKKTTNRFFELAMNMEDDE